MVFLVLLTGDQHHLCQDNGLTISTLNDMKLGRVAHEFFGHTGAPVKTYPQFAAPIATPCMQIAELR